jgi:nicotinamide-nucleotide amidase
MIDNFGAVSQEVALTMAEKVKEKGKVDIGLGITGIAGPTGGSKEKPVGLVYIALSTKKENICKKFNFKGNREEIRKKSSQKALEMILEI